MIWRVARYGRLNGLRSYNPNKEVMMLNDLLAIQVCFDSLSLTFCWSRDPAGNAAEWMT